MQEKTTPNSEDKPEILSFSSLHDIGEFINYIEDISILEFAEAVKDKHDNILVQKNAFLRPGIFENLKARKPSDIPNRFVFFYNKRLKQKYISLVHRKLFACLEPRRIHIASEVVKLGNVSYTSLCHSLFDNRDLLEIFVELDRNMEPILPHLGEVALLTASIVDHFCLEYKIEANLNQMIKDALFVGLLHDIALADDSDFLLNDLEKAKESGHEKKSQIFVEKKFSDSKPELAKIIGNHHREQPAYQDVPKKMPEATVIISEALIFAEFFFVQLRSMYRMPKDEKGSPVEKIFFMVGQAIGDGYLHPGFMKVIIKLQNKFKSIIRYGQQVGAIEKMCIFGDSAVAYPTPRCAQILCRDKKHNCEYLLRAYPIRIVKAANVFGRSSKKLYAGDYPKCQLSKKLPLPPKEIQSQA